jgi:MoaA/NifB/PqqE/SkfB family radical SAM enzyme/Tfp pilus assembly protein PilF
VTDVPETGTERAARVADAVPIPDAPDGRLDALCRAPSTQLHFDPHGGVAVCSKSTHRRLGHVLDGDLRALWLGPGLAAIRDALARGRFPDGCETCAWHLQHGNVADHPARTFDARPLPVDAAWPSHLEFAFSNRCNLACVQCSPELSSTIRARQGLPPLRSPYDDRFFAQIEPFVAHAQGVSLLGGEPFLQPECFRLLELLIAAGRRIPVHVTTNGTVFDARVERLLGHLPVQVAVSLDGVRTETIERIRVGANAVELLANARRFARHAQLLGRQFTLNFCLMRENWRELPDLFLLAQELGAAAWVVPVTHPPEMSLFTLPAESRREVARAWREREADVLRAATDKQKRTWSSLLAMFEEREAGANATWHAPRRTAAALVRIVAGDLAGAQDELDAVLPQSSESEGAHVVLQVLRMVRFERDGAAGTAPFAAAAAEIARLAVESPAAVTAAFHDGAMATACRLVEVHLTETATHVARCAPESDPQYRRWLLLLVGHHFDRREIAEARALLDVVARAGERSPEWWLRSAWIELAERRVDAARVAVAEGEAALAAQETPEPWIAVGLERARAYVHVMASESDAAAVVLRRLLARDPQDAEALRLERLGAAVFDATSPQDALTR